MVFSHHDRAILTSGIANRWFDFTQFDTITSDLDLLICPSNEIEFTI